MSSTLAPPPSYGPATVPMTPTKPASEGTVRPRPLATVEGLSAERLAAEVDYGESLVLWNADAEKLRGLKAHVCDDPETVSLETLCGRRDKVQAAELALAQGCEALTHEFASHAESRVPELATAVETRGEELAATEEKVVAKLKGIGITVESQPAYPANVEAARRTFAIRVRESADWQAANRKLGEAKEAHIAAVEAVTTGRAQWTKAQAALTATVKRLAGV